MTPAARCQHCRLRCHGTDFSAMYETCVLLRLALWPNRRTLSCLNVCWDPGQVVSDFPRWPCSCAADVTDIVDATYFISQRTETQFQNGGESHATHNLFCDSTDSNCLGADCGGDHQSAIESWRRRRCRCWRQPRHRTYSALTRRRSFYLCREVCVRYDSGRVRPTGFPVAPGEAGTSGGIWRVCRRCWYQAST